MVGGSSAELPLSADSTQVRSAAANVVDGTVFDTAIFGGTSSTPPYRCPAFDVTLVGRGLPRPAVASWLHPPMPRLALTFTTSKTA